MLRHIFGCYKSPSNLNRKEFFVAFLFVSVVFLPVFLGYSKLVSIDTYQVKYLIGKSLIELLAWGVMIPIFMARLRDMTWPTSIAYGVIPLWLVSAKHLIIYMELTGLKTYSGKSFFYGELTLNVIFLGVLLCMLFIKAPSNKSLQPTANASAE